MELKLSLDTKREGKRFLYISQTSASQPVLASPVGPDLKPHRNGQVVEECCGAENVVR